MATKSIISNEFAGSQINQTSRDLDCLEENTIEDPDSIALLGRIMLLSTSDFSLISKPVKQPLEGAEETTEEDVHFTKRDEFEHITHPESFRATLVQVSNAGYHAFLAAHTNMDKIRLACDNTQQHIELITECIIEGEDCDIITIVPVSLKSMRETAQECAEWSGEICRKFHQTLELLEEVDKSCCKVQATNKKKLEELEGQKDKLTFKKENAEKNKQEEQNKIEEIEKNMDQERDAFLKDFEESEHKITELKNEVISEENDLENLKIDQIKSKNLDKELGWLKWLPARQVMAKDEKNKIDNQVIIQESVLYKKKKEVDTKIKEQKKNINQKEEDMKLNEASGLEEMKPSIEKIEAFSKEISETFVKLNTTDVKELDIEDIMELLKDAEEKIAEIEAHWKQLVEFFEKISNVTEVEMGKAIEDFANAGESANLQGKVARVEEHWKGRVLFFEKISNVTEMARGKAIEDFSNAEESENFQGKVAEGSSDFLKNITKKKLMQFVFNAYSGCSGINNVSKTYLKISNTYLMPSIIHLGTLLAIEAEKESEKFTLMTEEIQCTSQMVKMKAIENK